MKLNLSLSVAALCLSAATFGQQLINGRGCATPLPPAGWDQAFNKKVDEHRAAMQSGKTMASTYTIPVVVHVIYGAQNVGVYPNLSVAQINSQISVLNADFAGNGYNVSHLAATAFSAVGAANTGITFCLAQIDPSGNTMDQAGIDRVSYTTLGSGSNPNSFSSQSSFQNYMDNTVKPATIWDPTQYFNIWVTDVNANVGLLGYSTFPGLSTLSGLSGSNSTAINDGIWVWAKAFGNTGFLSAPYNKGRTASHETGHYLGLRHIGGDGQANGTGNGNVNGDCTATDYCNDTPPQKGGYGSGQYGQNYGAPTYPLYDSGSNSCSSAPYGNMFMNFMDYTDDAITIMFTPDQVTRMHTAMDNSPYRNELTNSSALLCPATATYDAISKNTILSNNIRLAPNPSNGVFTLNTTLPFNQDLEVIIYNALGQQVFNTTYEHTGNNSFTISLENYPAGVYSIAVSSGSDKAVKKLILNK